MNKSNDMQKYVGTKIINAKPMNLGDYCKFRGGEVKYGDSPETEGYLVEYLEGGKTNTEEYAGYVSWSPKDVFDRCYRKIDL